jgi:hypothetical protein
MAPPEYRYPVYDCFEEFSLWPCVSYVGPRPLPTKIISQLASYSAIYLILYCFHLIN